MARTYTNIFPESSDTASLIVRGNDIVRIDMQYETRFNSIIKSLAKPYDVIESILNMYPKQVYIAGGLINLALDPLIDTTNPVYNKSDIDLFILADNPNERMVIIQDILIKLYRNLGSIDYGADDKGKYHILNESSMCVGVRGSVVYVWHNRFERMIQLVLMDTKNYPSIDSVIKGFDLDNIAVAYDGCELIIQKRAWQAMNTRRVTYRPTSVRNDNQLYRMTKTASRGYKIISNSTSEDITPSLAQILADKESWDYLCTPYTEYLTLLQRFLKENNGCRDATVKGITKYYESNTTASKVFYIDYESDIVKKVIPLVNLGGISNIESSREYSSAPATYAEHGLTSEVTDEPGPCTYVTCNRKQKVITLDTIDNFTSNDLVLVSLDNEHASIAFPCYASMRSGVSLALNLDKPIVLGLDGDVNTARLYLSELDKVKIQEFLKKFVFMASNRFYTLNDQLKEFTPSEKIKELTKYNSIWARTLVDSPRVDKVDRLTKLNKLIEASKSGETRTVTVCVNAYVRGDDISRYIRAKARTQSKRPDIPEVGVSFHLCL